MTRTCSQPSAAMPAPPPAGDGVRVLHVIAGLDPRGGGPPMALAGLAQAQMAVGMHVSIFACSRRGESDALRSQLVQRGARVRVVGPARGPFRWHHDTADALAAMLANTDIVHIHGAWEDALHRAARLASRRAMPYVITTHGMLDPWSLKQHALRKQLYMLLRLNRDLKGASLLHCTSQTESELIGPLGLKTPRWVEPIGIDLREFETLPPAGTFRARYPQLGSRPIVLFLSRLYPGKGLELLIPAFAKTRLEDAMLVIAGPVTDAYKAELQAKVNEHGLAERTIFTGMLYGPDRVAVLADADLFVLPSHHENFGIAVVEALAAGTPVIISDQVNIHADISAGQVGGVVPLDLDALTKEIAQWMRDTPRRMAAAGRARPFVWSRYDWNEIARHWDAAYRAQIARSRARRQRSATRCRT